MPASAIQGRPLWYELMTTDTAAAEHFYTKVVGWTTAPFDGAASPYTMWTRGAGIPVGGMMALPDDLKARGVPPHWMLHVGVDRLADAVAQIEKLGGGTLSPIIDVPGVGRMRAMKDPQGAAFSIFQPASPPQPEAPPELGDTSWHELYTTDGAAALSFYEKAFGWKNIDTMDMGEMGKYYLFGRGAGMLGGMMTKTPDMAQVPNVWLLYFRVPDVHAAAGRVKANGGTVMHGPMEVPGGDWIVQCMDPQGGMFAVHHKKG